MYVLSPPAVSADACHGEAGSHGAGNMSVRIRIVVADQSEARFYDLTGPDGPLVVAGHLTDPKAHLHDRDLKSSPPGRVFDHAPPAFGRRGSVAHHATGGERSPRKQEAQRFAREIARELDQARQDRFDRLVLVAAPPFLGLLRAEMSKPLHTCVVAEVPKDLVHQDEKVLREHLPRDVYAEGV